MSVEWQRLRILDAVARTGSVTSAAALLQMTGPAVSQQLRKIESEADVRVVAPDGRGVRLTPEGRVLAGYASQVAELMAQAEKDLRQDDELVGHLRVGALASTVRTTLKKTLPDFRRLHPRVEVCIEDGETAEQLTGLADGSLDVVLAESWSPTPLRLPDGVAPRRLLREAVWAAIPEGHPLHAGTRVDLADLESEAWATCARGSDGHQALTQAARGRGLDLDIRHFVADHATQLSLVQAGLAVACVPHAATTPATPGVSYRTLTPAMHRDILLLTSTRTLPLPLEALVAHLTGTP